MFIVLFIASVVIKVEVHNRSENSTTTMETQRFHQAIEDLGSRFKLRSHQDEKRVNELKDEGIQILNSQLDKNNIFVWLWCCSHSAIEYIQKMYESNQLRDVLCGFSNMRSLTSNIIQATEVNIDRNQFQKTIGK